MSDAAFNPLADTVRHALMDAHPEWSAYVGSLAGGDVEVVIPAPRGSRARQLIISTDDGQDIWLRFAPPYMAYCVGSEYEMHAVIAALLRDDAFFVVVTRGDDWLETALLRPGEAPVLLEGQTANIVSWSGLHDRIVTYTESRRTGGV
jgi:hypothetical protein